MNAAIEMVLKQNLAPCVSRDKCTHNSGRNCAAPRHFSLPVSLLKSMGVSVVCEPLWQSIWRREKEVER